MTSDQSEFGTSIRGYDREAVDEAIRLLRKELLQVGSLNAQLAAELREKSALAEDLQRQLDEAAAPNYASVGTRAALILSTAEEQSLQIVADAEAERERILGDLETELAALRDEAKEYYDSVVTEAQRRAERLQAQAKADYDQTLKEASNAASALIDEATREAGAIRGQVATEAARLRATAKREAELLKVETARRLSEQRLIEFKKTHKEPNIQGAEELVSEQYRIDLELELTARRAEAEAEYLRKHQEAVQATQKYLDEAGAVLATSRARANAAKLEAETLEAAAKSINKRLRDETKEQVEQLLVNAEAQGRAIIAEAEARSRSELRRLKQAIAKLNNERDAVLIYLKNLRSVVDAAQESIAD